MCVEVFNPPSGGATQPFDVTLLPAEGDKTPHQCILALWLFSEIQKVECNTKLENERGTSVKCQNCNIVQDNVCHVKENTKNFELILSLPFTYIFNVNISQPRTTITVDDSREPECCVFLNKCSGYIYTHSVMCYTKR